MHIVNAAGQVVAEYSYDAWGRMRDVNTHMVYAAGTEPELFLGRGYTGHEHLPWFGLINMNARLYDPVHARFLAPDPYVQAPDFTQSFNRYSYAWGNPLRYTDPSGEVFVIDDILIGAAIGALIGAATYTITVALSPGGFQNWNWGQFAKSVGIGAISGAVTAGIGQMFSAGNILGGLKDGAQFFAQAGMHGLAQGGMSLLDGGNFWQGFASGALGSMGAAGFGKYLKNVADKALGQIAFGALSGAIGAEATGGEWWKGAIIGGMVAGLNHTAHDKLQPKYNVAVFLDEQGAGYMGHEAIAFEQRDGSYNYVSKDGAINGGPVGKTDFDDINLKSLESIKSHYLTKTGNSYDKVALYKATRAQINKGYNSAKKFVKTTYSVIGNSCTTLVSVAMSVTFNNYRALMFEGSIPKTNFYMRRYTYSKYFSSLRKL